jgi:CDGSH-type Zn-finger protein
MWLGPGGPLMVEGPVELIMDDGTTVCSDRFMVAVCTCRRSRRYPICDTSHRRRVRTDSDPDAGVNRGDGATDPQPTKTD